MPDSRKSAINGQRECDQIDSLRVLSVGPWLTKIPSFSESKAFRQQPEMQSIVERERLSGFY